MKRIRVGIVGCGEVSQIIHLPSLQQLADRYEVTALCDISRGVLDTVGNQWGIERRFTDYEELVQQADVDAVLIANPHAYHSDVVLAAAGAGKHVLVEKPMCISLQEADEIIKARDDAGVVVQVGYMRRYAPAFVEACRVVKDMGHIRMARVHDVIGSNSLIIQQTANVIRGDDISAELKQEGNAHLEQKVTAALGSETPSRVRGAYLLMLGLSSHDISAMREMIGVPRQVLYARWQEGGDLAADAGSSRGVYLTAAFDYGHFICHFETGIDQIPRFDGHIEVFGPEKVLKVQYDTPYVRHLPIRLLLTEAHADGGMKEKAIQPSWEDAFVAEWRAFYHNITEDEEPKSGPEDFKQDLEIFMEMVDHIR